MEINRALPKGAFGEVSENTEAETPQSSALQAAAENVDQVEDVSAASPISPDLADALEDQMTQTAPNEGSWIQSMTEPAADGSVTIDLKTFQAPEKKPGDWRDTDHDGLTDAQEAALGTDPLHDADADGDGVPDAVEVTSGMNPFDADTDHDGIPDGVEYQRSHLAALVPAADASKASDTDWDGDGFSNETELMYGMNPSVPESKIPGNEQRMKQNYEFRKNADPLHDAILAKDLQQQLTPDEEGKILDAVFDGMTSGDILAQYHTAVALNQLDGTPIDPKLEASMEKYNTDLTNALVNRDLSAWKAVQNARGLSVNDATINSFLNPTASQLYADVRTAMLALGVQNPTDGTALGNSLNKALGIASDTSRSTPPPGNNVGGTTGTSAGGTESGSTESLSGKQPSGSNLAEAFLDRTPTFESPGTDENSNSSDSPTSQDTPETPTSSAGGMSDIDSFLAKLEAPTNEGPEIPASRGGTEGVAPPESPSMDSFNQTGGSGRTAIVTGDEDGMTVSNIVDEQTTTRPDGTIDHTTVTYTDGSKDILDAEGKMIFHIDPPPPEADAGSETNPNVGTTDNDGVPPEDDSDGTSIDDGNSEEGTAYVNPDADVIGIPVSMSPMAEAMVTTGTDPRATTPSGPYVDDAVGPIVVDSAAISAGRIAGPRPGVIDGNPELETISGGGGSKIGSAATGPDTINPDDPLVGSGGEDINPDDFTPPPSKG